MALVRLSGHHGDRSFETLNAQVMRFVDGRIAEFWEAPTDPDAMRDVFA
ncbi:hypothetical protein [Geodermatophilus sp. CPCC 205761]